jgi:hypothetical protein
MYGRIELELWFGERLRGGNAMVDPERWAEKMETELRERERTAAGKDEVLVAKRKLLDSQSELLWKRLGQSLGALARAFNKRRNILEIEDDGGDTFNVRRSDDAGKALLAATFSHLENRITLHIRPGEWFQSYVGKVIPGGGEGVVSLVREHEETATKNQYEIDEIATEAMEELLKSRS